MSETKHTPGPWRIVSLQKRKHTDSNRPLIASEKANICSLDVAGREYGKEIANGRLIAAAPDLLKAAEECERLLLDHGDPFRGDDWQAMQDIRAAIAKAKGGE